MMPCLDEAAALPAVIAGLRAGPEPDARVVVADNGSRDGSGALAAGLGCDVVVEPRRGYGGAVQAGIAHLAALPADAQPDILVILDADHAADAADLPALLGPIRAGRADLVIGERLTRGTRDGLTAPQRVGNRLVTTFIRARTGHRATDLGPFRAIRWSALRALGMEDPTWGWNVEMHLKALRAGLRVIEVPVANRARIGRSKISGTVQGVVRAGVRMVYACWRYG